LEKGGLHVSAIQLQSEEAENEHGQNDKVDSKLCQSKPPSKQLCMAQVGYYFRTNALSSASVHLISWPSSSLRLIWLSASTSTCFSSIGMFLSGC